MAVEPVCLFVAGGGSGGHSLPLVSFLQAFKRRFSQQEIKIFAFGRIAGIERELLASEVDVYLVIPSGKLRRYFSRQNFSDLFRVLKAVYQSFKFLVKYRGKRNIFLSTGGFVSLPPLISAFFLKIPIFLHEQTTRIGLANFVAKFFARKIFLSFEESLQYYPLKKSSVEGYPLRDMFFQKRFLQEKIKNRGRKILLITGGGNGSKIINQWVKDNLPKLLAEFFVVHQTGEKDFSFFKKIENQYYQPLRFLNEAKWVDFMKKSALIISRAGAGVVSECIFLNKKVIFIPLKIAQRNEQYFNALAARKFINCYVVKEDNLKSELNLKLIKNFLSVHEKLTPQKAKKDVRESMVEKMLQETS